LHLSRFPFIYNPAGHVISGDLKIINNTSLRDVFAKGLKYREYKSINWKHNFKMFRRGLCQTMGKREKEYIDTLSEWVRSVRSLMQIKIKNFSSGP
jgi:hypothetical protein